MEKIFSEIECDYFDTESNYHTIDGWKNGNDQGQTIAVVNDTTLDVWYITPEARIDPFVPMVIDRLKQNILGEKVIRNADTKTVNGRKRELKYTLWVDCGIKIEYSNIPHIISGVVVEYKRSGFDIKFICTPEKAEYSPYTSLSLPFGVSCITTETIREISTYLDKVCK